MAIPHSQIDVFSQATAEINLSDEYDSLPKYEVGFSYYSHFRDYQHGYYYVSKIDFSGEFGYSLFSSMMVGINIHLTYESERAKSDGDGHSVPRVSFGPYLRYYFNSSFYFESGIGLGRGKISFHDDSGNLMRDFEEVRLSRFHVAAGYDIPLTKKKSLVVRPSVYYMQKKQKIPEYPESANNNKESEIGLSISLIIHFYTPKNLL
jgi:hypothetical protein